MSDEKLTPTPKSHDPGWNDPPTMGYSAASQPAVKSKPSLNKRVAFPMQSSDIAANTKVQTSSAGLPMPFARVKQQPPPPEPSASTAVKLPLLPPANRPPPPKAESILPAHHVDNPIHEPIVDPEVSHAKTIQTLQTILKSVTGLDAVKSDEIEKRLGVLSTMWLDNRLDSKLQLRLAQISEYISNGSLTEATELHRSLAVDYGSISMQWGSALRQLIIAKQHELQPAVVSDVGTPVEQPTEESLFMNPDSVQFHEVSMPPVKGRILHI